MGYIIIAILIICAAVGFFGTLGWLLAENRKTKQKTKANVTMSVFSNRLP